VTKSGITLGFYTNSVKLKNTLKKDFYIITQRSQMGIYNNGSLALSRSIWPLVIFKESISSQIGSTTTKYLNGYIQPQRTVGWPIISHSIGLLKSFYLEPNHPAIKLNCLFLIATKTTIPQSFYRNIKLITFSSYFFPFHSTHILKTLDLLYFYLIKSKYQEQIAKLIYINNTAPIKKHYFIKCYYKA